MTVLTKSEQMLQLRNRNENKGGIWGLKALGPKRPHEVRTETSDVVNLQPSQNPEGGCWRP